MHSLTYLNTYGATSLELTDNRPATVTFSRIPPMLPLDQILDITSTILTIEPGIDLTEIINYSTTNAQFRIEIVTGGTNPLVGSTVSWSSLPAHLTLSQVGNVYTISGLKSITDWNAIRTFTWNLPANYDEKDLWYLNSSVIYFDESLNQTLSMDWTVYDPRFYYIAQLNSSITLTAGNTRIRQGQSLMEESPFVMWAVVGTVEYGEADLVIETSMSISVVDATLYVNSSLSADNTRLRLLTQNISSNSTLEAKTLYSYFLQDTIPLTNGIAISSTGEYIGINEGIYQTTNYVDWDFIGSTTSDQYATAMSSNAEFVMMMQDISYGRILIYEKSGTTWTNIQQISADGTNTWFNRSIISCSSDGKYICVVSDALTDPKFHVYYKASTTWTLQQTITVTESEPFVNVKADISSAGDVIAFSYRINTSFIPKLKVYTRSGTTWTNTASFTVSSGSSLDNINDLKISGDGHTIVASVKLYGSETMITYSDSSGSWVSSLSIDVAADRAEINETGDIIVCPVSATRIYVYQRSVYSWKRVATINAPTGTTWGSQFKLSNDAQIFAIGANLIGSGRGLVTEIYKLGWY